MVKHLPQILFRNLEKKRADSDLSHLGITNWEINFNMCISAAFDGDTVLAKKSGGYYARKNIRVCACAAYRGQFDFVKWGWANKFACNELTCASAALGGNLDILKWLHKNGCPWDKDTCADAAKNDHLACLQYAHENGCPWDGCSGCAKATLKGHLARHSDTNVSNHEN